MSNPSFKKNQTVIFMIPSPHPLAGTTSLGVISRINKTSVPMTWNIKRINPRTSEVDENVFTDMPKQNILSTKGGPGNIGVPWAAVEDTQVNSTLLGKLQNMTLDDDTPATSTLQAACSSAKKESIILPYNKYLLLNFIKRQLNGDHPCTVGSQPVVSKDNFDITFPQIIIKPVADDVQTPNVPFLHDDSINIIMKNFTEKTGQTPDNDKLNYECIQAPATDMSGYYYLPPATSNAPLTEGSIDRFQTTSNTVLAYIDSNSYNFYFVCKATKGRPAAGASYNIFVQINDKLFSQMGAPDLSSLTSNPLRAPDYTPPEATEEDRNRDNLRKLITVQLTQLYNIMDIKTKLTETDEEHAAKERAEEQERAKKLAEKELARAAGGGEVALSALEAAEKAAKEEEEAAKEGQNSTARGRLRKILGGNKRKLGTLAATAAAAAYLAKKQKRTFNYNTEDDPNDAPEPEPASEAEPAPAPASEAEPEPASEAEPEPSAEPKSEPSAEPEKGNFDMSSGVPSLSMDGDGYGFVYY